ncbi:MAG TPA: PD-(D/E)XK nuclease family protein [Nitriliruptorales bacterium]
MDTETDPQTVPQTATVPETGPETGPEGGRLPLVDDEGRPFEAGELDELEPEHPPLIDEHGRVRLSFSRIDTYRTCSLQFRYAYIDRLPGRAAPALSFGTSIHAALERFYDRKIPQTPSEDDLVGFLYDLWDPTGFKHVSREEQLANYRFAQDVLRRWYRREARTGFRMPAETERWFELGVDGVATVVGSIDRLDVVDDDGNLEVIDYKTNRRLKTREQVAGSLQLAIYALACQHLFGRLPAAVSLDFVVPGVRVRVPLEELDLDGAREAIVQTADRVRAELYEPTPNRLCNWCDFRALCPAWQGEGPELLGPAMTELEQLRRNVRRDVARMRHLEAGVARAYESLGALEH